MTSVPFDPPQWAKNARPSNVRATGSAAPEQYSPLAKVPDGSGDLYTVRSHAAQYGKGRRYGITIRTLILHTTESESFSSSVTYNTWRAEQVSSTAHAGPRGELAIEIDEENRPWTTGRWNDESLSLEIVGRASWGPEIWRGKPDQMEAITRWLVDGCRRHSIPPRLLTAAQFAEGASRSGESPLRAGHLRGIVDHRTANDAAIMLGHSPSKYSHHDIGAGLRQVVAADIMPEVARRLGTVEPPNQPSTRNWTNGGTVLHTLEPHDRLLDTRKDPKWRRRVNAGEVVEIPIPAPPGVTPATAIVNVTVVDPSEPGFVQVTGAIFGESSVGNFVPGESPEASPCIAAVVDGVISVRLSRAAAHLVVDLQGVVG